MTHPSDDPSNDPFVNRLFEAARAKPEPVPADLFARMLADAAQNQPRAAMAPSSVWAMVVQMLGGRGALAGLGAAAACGLALGFMIPVDLMPEPTVDLFPVAEGLIALLDAGA
jgi:hypothetical protein